MPDERNYYVIRDDNCLFPAMTAEQVLEAIAEATGAAPTPVDEAYITKIKEGNANGTIKFWVGTEAQFNAITPAVTANVLQIRRDSAGKWYAITDGESGEYVPVSRTVNGKDLSTNITLNANDVGAVPKERKICGRTLDSDIQLDAQDVLAAPYDHTHSEYLPKAGGTMTGQIKTKGIKLTGDVDYGETFPSNPAVGQLFFKKVT